MALFLMSLMITRDDINVFIIKHDILNITKPIYVVDFCMETPNFIIYWKGVIKFHPKNMLKHLFTLFIFEYPLNDTLKLKRRRNS